MDRSRRIIVNGIEIREAVIGAGDPILMVHGWGADIGLLHPLARQLESFGYQIYMLDLPGFGESSPPRESFSIFDYSDFCAAYLDFHGLPRVHYFGHSLGGRIGLLMAVYHAHRIRSMVLSNSAGIRAPSPIATRFRQWLYKKTRDSLRLLGARETADDLQRRYSQRYASADYLTASPIMRGTLVKVVNQDLLEMASEVAIPTVLIWGDQDEETPLWMGKKLELTIPDAALIVHEGAGHYAYLDNLDETASIMHALFKADQTIVEP